MKHQRLPPLPLDPYYSSPKCVSPPSPSSWQNHENLLSDKRVDWTSSPCAYCATWSLLSPPVGYQQVPQPCNRPATHFIPLYDPLNVYFLVTIDFPKRDATSSWEALSSDQYCSVRIQSLPHVLWLLKMIFRPFIYSRMEQAKYGLVFSFPRNWFQRNPIVINPWKWNCSNINASYFNCSQWVRWVRNDSI